ncbi:hypothetical protein CFP56_010238 [Quercus suber]|uniref:Uncharacterized protein n=1 Tax=Quercus suber TaxID=58331 RepID=A0AAW0L0L5_QUESU
MTSKHCHPFQYERNSVAPKPVPNSGIEIMDVTAAANWWKIGQEMSPEIKMSHKLILEVLIQTECFAQSYLYMLKRLILEILKNRIPKMRLKYCLMNRTFVSVLFLDEPELERVLAFL